MKKSKNLPVPVLAEGTISRKDGPEARESITPEAGKSKDGRSSRYAASDSRGGQNPLSGALNAGNEVAMSPKPVPPAQSPPKPKRRLERNAEHQKYYLKDGSIVGGCSSIAKLGDSPEGLIRWANQMGLKGIDSSRFRDKTADIGSLSHFMASCFLDGAEPDLREYDETDIAKAKLGYDKFLSFWEREKLELVASEKQLVSELFRYGGTLDLVARDEDNLLVLCELKSSKSVYPSHKWQLGGQEGLWNENYDEKIARRCILRIPPTGDGEFQVHWIPDEKAVKHINIFRAQANLFNVKWDNR